ncbi:MAG: flagellar FliJ protein [Bacillales bacterium]|jgi:flagellar FliJ protein|nr:flagellar FliJ protein [Bacillales bacterium]
MKFQFTFQKVLDFKEKEKELAEQEFGQIKTRALELQEQIDGLEIVQENAYKQYNDVDRKTVWEMLEFQQGIEYINHKMKLLEDQSKKVHLEVEQKHQILIEKNQETKVWNRWKSKSLVAFQLQMQQKEQAMLDELAVTRYLNKM